MKANEQYTDLVLSRRLVNLLTSMMPQLEGLFLATVYDGKKGHVRLLYDAGVTPEIEGLVADLKARYGDEVGPWEGPHAFLER